MAKKIIIVTGPIGSGKSTTIEYCNNFISSIKNKDFDIVEIHNRPLVFTYLKKIVFNKYPKRY